MRVNRETLLVNGWYVHCDGTFARGARVESVESVVLTFRTDANDATDATGQQHHKSRNMAPA